MTPDNGRYVVVGQYTDAGSVEINPHWDINRKYRLDEMNEALTAVEELQVVKAVVQP